MGLRIRVVGSIQHTKWLPGKVLDPVAFSQGKPSLAATRRGRTVAEKVFDGSFFDSARQRFCAHEFEPFFSFAKPSVSFASIGKMTHTR
jgi:hypothetical protein